MPKTPKVILGLSKNRNSESLIIFLQYFILIKEWIKNAQEVIPESGVGLPGRVPRDHQVGPVARAPRAFVRGQRASRWVRMEPVSEVVVCCVVWHREVRICARVRVRLQGHPDRERSMRAHSGRSRSGNGGPCAAAAA